MSILPIIDNADVMFLESNISKLPSDYHRNSAASLIRAYRSVRGITEKQALFLVDLISKVRTRPLDAIKLPNICALLEHAASHGVKQAKIRLQLPDDAGEINLRRYWKTGVIYVTDTHRTFTDNTGTKRPRRYGLITVEGIFKAYDSAHADTLNQIIPKLTAFNANPHEAARVEGHATGHCIFCSRALTDARSVEMGYGSTCADHYGLPWGGGDASNERNVYQAMQGVLFVPPQADTV
jgi:hypothetical protein